MEEKHSDLCVGGPLAGKRFTSMRGSGFRVPVLTGAAAPDINAEDYRPNAKIKIADTHYRSEQFSTPQGAVTFWVPSDQTPLQTITMLLEAYERQTK